MNHRRGQFAGNLYIFGIINNSPCEAVKVVVNAPVCNAPPGALTRLVDMGVEPYLVASSLEAVLAQRLVRVLCTHCKQEDNSPTAQAFKASLGIPANATIYRSVGCRECRNTGLPRSPRDF